MYAQARVYVYPVLVCIHICGGQNLTLGIFLSHSPPFIFQTGSVTGSWSCWFGHMSWPASPSDLRVPHLPSMEIANTCHASWLLTRALEDWTQVLTLARLVHELSCFLFWHFLRPSVRQHAATCGVAIWHYFNLANSQLFACVKKLSLQLWKWKREKQGMSKVNMSVPWCPTGFELPLRWSCCMLFRALFTLWILVPWVLVARFLGWRC